nr:SET domain-containing protein 4 [Onthophagus taurus]
MVFATFFIDGKHGLNAAHCVFGVFKVMFYMGRTERIRRRKNLSQFSMDYDLKIINLKKWLNRLGWKNDTKLKLTHFKDTGRGILSKLKISPNDKLVSIPYEAMITYISFEETKLYDILKKFPKMLSTEEAFTIFMCLEDHKGDDSKWKIYLDSLPEESLLPLVPWGLNNEEYHLIPDEILRKINKYLFIIDKFSDKIKNILTEFNCECCNRNFNQIITREKLYKNYVLFMTRCFYLNYKVLKHFSKRYNFEKLFIDEPNMVLCPLLDMFNHSSETDDELKFEKINENSYLNVITKNTFSKNSQLFFCYGKHDNLSLFCYYGFYLDKNPLDFIEFTNDDVQLLFENIKVNEEKVRFIKAKNINENLIWHLNEPTFNLLTISYIISTRDTQWKTKVYDDFNEVDLKLISNVLKILINRRIDYIQERTQQMEMMIENKSECLLFLINFCKHRLNIMRNIVITQLKNC